MKTRLVVVSFTILMAGGLAHQAAAGPVAVLNPSFEDNKAALVPSDGNFTVGVVPEWEDNFPAPASAGLFNPPGTEPTPPNGDVVLFLNPGGFVVQDLENGAGSFIPFNVGDTIHVEVDAHDRNGTMPQLRADIRTLPNTSIVGGSQLMVVNDAVGYSTLFYEFTVATAASQGFLVFDGVAPGQINLDNVRVTVVPEPASIAIWSLLGLVGVSGYWIRRKTRK